MVEPSARKRRSRHGHERDGVDSREQASVSFGRRSLSMLGSVQHELGNRLGEAPLARIFVRSDDARHRALENRCRKRSPQSLTRRRAGMQTGRRIGHRKGAIARAFRAEHIAEWRAAARAGMHRIDRSYARDAIVAYESTGTLASGTARR